MAIVGIRRVPIVAIMLAAAVYATTALAGIGRSIEHAIDRTLRWLFAASPMRQLEPAFALDCGGPSPAPLQSTEISAQLYQRNRHEAHSHARAADRAI